MSSAEDTGGRQHAAGAWPAPWPAPEWFDDDLIALLDADPPAIAVPDRGLRQRLFDRVQRSADAARLMLTRRHRDAPVSRPQAGVTVRTLYAAAAPAQRPGEPQRSCLVEVGAGSRWANPGPGGPLQREWLVLRGTAQLGALALAAEDFHLAPAGAPAPALTSTTGALLLLREAPIAAPAGTHALTQRAADAAWSDYGPGIQRRVMWTHAGQSALLYRALPGAAVPRHHHHHDEECLMLAGDLFLDEVLLRPLDYQLAPAGTLHTSVSTDTGVLLYAHGDADLALLPD